MISLLSFSFIISPLRFSPFSHLLFLTQSFSTSFSFYQWLSSCLLFRFSSLFLTLMPLPPLFQYIAYVLHSFISISLTLFLPFFPSPFFFFLSLSPSCLTPVLSSLLFYIILSSPFLLSMHLFVSSSISLTFSTSSLNPSLSLFFFLFPGLSSLKFSCQFFPFLLPFLTYLFMLFSFFFLPCFLLVIFVTCFLQF